MSTFCAPIDTKTAEQLNNLRKLFDGEKIIDFKKNTFNDLPHFELIEK